MINKCLRVQVGNRSEQILKVVDQTWIIDKLDHLRYKIQEYPNRYILVTDLVSKQLSYSGWIQLNDLDQLHDQR